MWDSLGASVDLLANGTVGGQNGGLQGHKQCTSEIAIKGAPSRMICKEEHLLAKR